MSETKATELCRFCGAVQPCTTVGGPDVAVTRCDVCDHVTELTILDDGSDAVATEPMFLVECMEHQRGDLVLWWAPDSNGYTVDVDRAGRYTLEEATRICHKPEDEKMWPEAEVLAKVRKVVVKR